jgi:hypothetical protein
VRKFANKFSVSKLVRDPRLVGIVPLKLFSCSDNTSRFLFASSFGIAPVNWFIFNVSEPVDNRSLEIESMLIEHNLACKLT